MTENQIIHSFDATFSVEGELFITEKYRDLYFAMSERPFISRGAGVSYPLASAGVGVRSIVSLQFNRILEFNNETGVVKAESGLSVGELLKFLSQRGWWLPAIPGHPSITLGGCVAANVHGKSQYHSGLFADSVLEMELFHPRHGKILCLPKSLPFQLTAGGFGLTGHILSVSIQCKPLTGKSLVRTSLPCANIFECIELMQNEKDQYQQVYSWNDLNQKGEKFGAGYVYYEKFGAEAVPDIQEFNVLYSPPRSSLMDQVFAWTLKNRISQAYSMKESFAPKSQSLGILAGAFPINGKEIYHRLFGKNGLLESQIIIPHAELKPVIEKLSLAIAEFGGAVSLGSLKIFRGQQNYINFLTDGICLALNVPNSARALDLFRKIDEICEDHHCLSNIAKDSRLTQDVVAATYEGYQQFKKDIFDFDPSKTVSSALRVRLGL
ncbi:MAG TPA: FAD-binding protein [Pseudobdellovibrionaceae bacterium]|jgi:decaprenylphospho-beta-D-ribofuranose 2-oxidase